MAESMKGLKRTARCAELNESNIGQVVTVMGWVQKNRNKGGICFVDLRDRSGILQIIFEENKIGAEGFEKAGSLRSEYVIAVKGTVCARAGAVNEQLATGKIEVVATELRVLSEAETPPFPIESDSKTKEEIRLKSFYLAWFDDWRGQIYNFYRPQFISGEIEGLHTVYDSIAEGLDTAHFPAWQEVEISVPGSGLLLNTSGKLDHAIFGTNGFNSMGYTDYSDCINASDYEEGAECKLMISGDKWMAFFPPRAEMAEPDPIATPDTSDTTDDPGEPGTITNATTGAPEPAPNEPTDDAPEESGKGSVDTATSESKVASTAYTNSNIPPRAPDTGAYPAEVCSREINMPWWIIALILAGNALLIWWFTPNRHHLRQNPQKSPKKS